MQATRDVQSQHIKGMCYSKKGFIVWQLLCPPPALRAMTLSPRRVHFPAREELPQLRGHQSEASDPSFSARDPKEPVSGEHPRPLPGQTSVTCSHVPCLMSSMELRPQPGAHCPGTPKGGSRLSPVSEPRLLPCGWTPPSCCFVCFQRPRQLLGQGASYLLGGAELRRRRGLRSPVRGP